MEAILVSAKVSVFQQDQINYHCKPSQRSYLAQIRTKTPKIHLNRGKMKNLFENRKEKYWVISQEALFFKAF